MLMRVLTMKVRQEHLEGWKRYTAEVGFPGMPWLQENLAHASAGSRSKRIRSGYVVGQHRGFRSLQGKRRHARAERQRCCLHDTPYREVLYEVVPG